MPTDTAAIWPCSGLDDSARRRTSADIASASATIHFAEVMERVAGIVRAVEPHDSVERYTALGVDVVIGNARLLTGLRHITLKQDWNILGSF